MKFKDRPKNPSAFLKIKPSETVKGVFSGEPLDFYQHWQGQKASVCALSLGAPECGLCKSGEKKNFRFRINILVKEDQGYYSSQIFEQGGVVYDQLQSLAQDFDLEKVVVKITRQGEGKQTKYTIVPLPGVLSDEVMKKLLEVPLQDLTKFGSDDSEDSEVKSTEDVPF